MKKYNFFQDDSKVRFQNFLLDEWFFRTKKIINENYSSKGKSRIIISERSPLTNIFIFINKLHEEGQLSDIDHHLLVNKSLEFQRLIIEDYQLSPLYIYLREGNEKILLNRVKNRNRHGEEMINADFLKSFTKRYDCLYNYHDHHHHHDQTIYPPRFIIELENFSFSNDDHDDGDDIDANHNVDVENVVQSPKIMMDQIVLFIDEKIDDYLSELSFIKFENNKKDFPLPSD